MDDLSPAGRVIGAGGVGAMSGAAACVAYTWLWLAAHGAALLFAYEPYHVPVFLLLGAAIGSVSGLRVGWQLRSPPLAARSLGRLSAARRLLWAAGQGAGAGAVIVSLLAAALALTEANRYDARYLVQVNAAGVVVGSLAAAASL